MQVYSSSETCHQQLRIGLRTEISKTLVSEAVEKWRSLVCTELIDIKHLLPPLQKEKKKKINKNWTVLPVLENLKSRGLSVNGLDWVINRVFKDIFL